MWYLLVIILIHKFDFYWQVMYQMPLQIAILFWKARSDELSLMSFAIWFQRDAPSYIKLFFIMFVRGFGKQRPLEISCML